MMNQKEKDNKLKIQFISLLIISIFLFYFFNNFFYRIFFYKNKLEAFNFLEYFNQFYISLDRNVFLLSTIIPFVVFLYVLFKISKVEEKKFEGKEYGSARWGKLDEIAPYRNDDPFRNIIMTKNLRINLDFLGKHPKYSRNKNTLVIGGSGTGKTRFFVKPNLMQMVGSYIVTDPKGSILEETGNMFVNNGYDLKVFNLKDLSKSFKYNPFKYMTKENDILKFVETLIANTKGEGNQSGEDFWVNAEKMYLQALIGYMFEVLDDEKWNISTLLDLVNKGSVQDKSDSELDIMFQNLKEVKGESFATRMYDKFKQGAGDTMRSILISVAARTVVFDIKQVRDLLMEDQLDLYNIGIKPTILFVILKDTDFSLNFLASIMYTQLLEVLVEQADSMKNNRFKEPVQLILDELANTGKIPNFQKIIVTIRSRNISAIPIFQSKAQIQEMYDKATETLIDNCDSFLFLGGQGKETLTDLVDDLGKFTMEYEVQNISYDKNNAKSVSKSKTKIGRELMTRSEISTMDNELCIYKLRGLPPFLDKKYVLEEHPNIKQITDGGEKKFNIYEHIDTYKHFDNELVIDNDTIINLYVAK